MAPLNSSFSLLVDLYDNLQKSSDEKRCQNKPTAPYERMKGQVEMYVWRESQVEMYVGGNPNIYM